MELNHSSRWESIVEKVKPHIPTIDFDSSPSDNEETATVYQRPAGLSLEVPEDFELFSMDDDQLEELITPGTQTCWSESVMLDDDEVVKGTSAAQRDADADVETGVCERETVELNRANGSSAESDEGFPVLSFARLDQWDLDDVLQNLKDDGLPLRHGMSVEPSKTHADGDKDMSHRNIMERLVVFCNSQSSKSVSEPVKSPNHTRHNNLWNKSLKKVEAELQLQERPTVYIDLRCSDPSIKPPRTGSNLSPASNAPAKLNTHWETSPAKKANVKVRAGSGMTDREVTGKSMLLQKIREMNKHGDTYLNEYTDPPSVPRSEAEEVKEKPPQPVESVCSHESHQLCGEKQSECRNSAEVEISPTTQQSTIKEPKQQSDQQRQQSKQTLQHEQHQKILKQLEMHRPLKSVNQKQPAAERTDVLYEFEASYLQSVSTLPADIESKGRMLLTVQLSSPGVVGVGARRRRNHTAATRSHIYNTLVAWFLSLVGPEPCHGENEVGAKVPFWVAGLQQLWTEDGLALHVLAVDRRSHTPRKRGIDIHTPFYDHVCRFLSETSLSVITHWLPQLNNLLDQQAYTSPIHLPASSLNKFISTTSSEKVLDRTFGLSPGFYWQTVETREHVCTWREPTQELHTEMSMEVSVALGSKAFLLHPIITHYTLQLVLDSGLDVCGLRLLYPPQQLLNDSAGYGPVLQGADESCQPVLALAVRGVHAHSVLKALTTSLHPLMPGESDLKLPVFLSSQQATQVHRDLCLWFSGRLQADRAAPLDDSQRNLSRSPSFLCATTNADLLLVVSPAVPPCCYGKVLAVCESRGFRLRGLQRLQLQSEGAAVLGLSNQQTPVFCAPQTVTLGQGQLELPSHCLVLLLRKENAAHHSVSLPAALMREFEAQQLLGYFLSRLHTADPGLCFHTVPYCSNLFHLFVRCMWAVPDPSAVILSHQKCSSKPDMEQVVILTLCGKDQSQDLSLLHRVLTEEPEGHRGFQLLGLKWLPALTRLQAQEVSPYEVGEQLCQVSLDKLMSSPALVCALRRVDAFASLKKLLPQDYPGNISVLMSPTPEVAFRQASLFFFEHEMIPDHSVPQFPPQNCRDPQTLLTVCLFKPTIWNQALAKIIHKLQLSGFTLVGLHVVTLDRSTAASLLPEQSDPSDLEAHVEYLCSGSSLALCLQGEDAVRRLLDVLDQEDSSLWTYYGMAHSYNGIYGSASYQKAIQDMKRLFPEGLCCTETSTMRQEQIPSMHSDALASLQREQSCTLESVSPSVASGPTGGIHSAPWQTTCLLIPFNAPALSPVPSQLDMLEQLLGFGCHLVAGRMSTLDNEQRKRIAETLKVSSSRDERMVRLHSAPCLIIALQGKEVVTGLDFILRSIYEKRPDLEKVGGTIIYPESQKKAEQLIGYLMPHLLRADKPLCCKDQTGAGDEATSE